MLTFVLWFSGRLVLLSMVGCGMFSCNTYNSTEWCVYVCVQMDHTRKQELSPRLQNPHRRVGVFVCAIIPGCFCFVLFFPVLFFFFFPCLIGSCFRFFLQWDFVATRTSKNMQTRHMFVCASGHKISSIAKKSLKCVTIHFFGNAL